MPSQTMRRASILFISTMSGIPWGGSEELWSAAAEKLVERGCSVSASVEQWPELAPRLARLAGKGINITMRRTSFERRVARKILGRLYLFNLYGEAIEAAAPHLILVSNGGFAPSPEAALACITSGIPYINIAHANRADWFPPEGEVALLRTYFSKATACWFVSEGNRSLTERQIGEPLCRSVIVRNPFSVPYSTSLPWPDAEDHSARLACVGRLHPPSKGHDILFEALSLEPWKRRNWTLSLFGEGPHREPLERLSRLFGISDRVEFRGHVASMLDVWREHHILVLPSRYEGLPIAVVEAMLCGRPVLATDVAGNGEVIEDGQTGFLAEAPTVRHFAEALERAWEDRHNWRAHGERAVSRIRQLVPEDPAESAVSLIEASISGRELSRVPAKPAAA
jgi:glycosyltransferase involved in cell wall biosynthesis